MAGRSDQRLYDEVTFRSENHLLHNCPICTNTPNDIDSSDCKLNHKIDCPQCGVFKLHGYDLEDQNLLSQPPEKRDPLSLYEKRELISSFIKRSQRNTAYPIWDRDKIQNILSNAPSRLSKQIGFIPEWLDPFIQIGS